MADALTAVDSIMVGVKPELDADKTITALTVSIALSYQAADGERIGRTVQINAWDLLDASQKATLQDVQQVLTAYIATTYFT